TKVAAFAAGSSRCSRIVFHAGSPAERQLFLLCDIPALRTNIRKVPRWSVYAIEYLARRKYQ
ncbi:MAG: hypothetical protein SPH62_05815, partial [Candidatus Egerieousia sp.]|nr:hypothetical protein [bacterium]MDY5255901.1 hypothetical protein [Candidatus Egerieousia sp.]